MDAPAPSRRYQSALRDRHAAQTRELILDAVTTLLGDRRADEVTTREIAAAAEVSERTVYRHFPDREALLEGLSRRVPEIEGVTPSFRVGGLDALAPSGRRLMELLEEHHVAAVAEAVLNADPRRFATETRTHSDELRTLVARELPQLDARDHLRIAAVLRCLLSAQAWLRMREEYGVSGTDSGPAVEWVIELIIRELRAGNSPPRADGSAARPSRARPRRRSGP
jgi:AcrR family transcriptional regulator